MTEKKRCFETNNEKQRISYIDGNNKRPKKIKTKNIKYF